LNETEAKPVTGTASRRAWVALNSRLLAAARYDARTKRLALRFRKGTLYTYLEVPPDVYKDFIAAPSSGAFFVSVIRDHYQFVMARVAGPGPKRELIMGAGCNVEPGL
jgi:hypothetical protein